MNIVAMYSKAEVLEFIKTYGALILSVYATVQIWIIALWKKLRRGKILIFEAGAIELGLSGLGPSIVLTGTLMARRKDVFVEGISIQLTRLSDREKFFLDWVAFRAPQIKVGDPTATTLEVPSGINVRVDQPVRYTIVFCDKKVQMQLNRLLAPVATEWVQFVEKNRAKMNSAVKRGGEPEWAVANQYFTKFIEASGSVKTAVAFHERANWWSAVTYRMKMVVKASTPDKTFSKEWMFSLDDESVDRFGGNYLATLREVCLGDISGYLFVYPEYIKLRR